MLEAQGLAAAHDGQVLFSDLSFTVAPGEILAIVGPSGSGKSTLLRAVACLTPLATGSLRYQGESPQALGPRQWRRRLAYVPQSPPLFDGSAFAFFSRVGHLQVQDAQPGGLERARALCREWRVRESTWEANFAVLSGGERQRLYLAMVLATEPEVLLLDEPTSALDAESRGAVEASLRARTALWVTHDEGQVERLGGRRLELGR